MRSFLYRVAIRSIGLVPTRPLHGFLTLLHRRSDVADRAGFSIFPLRFYNPFPEPSQVDLEKLKLRRTLPGIDFAVPRALDLLRELAPYSPEAAEFLKSRTGDLKHWEVTFSLNDSAILYAMLRHLKPKRYIEIGCGYSSRCSVAALTRNQQEGHACQTLFIEPYPPPYLTEMTLPGEFIQKKVQDAPLERFAELQAGDVLFIDTSHVIKAQNDVEYELLRILPVLRPGVIVHIHDIFTPYDYPADWLVGHAPSRSGNNEQYALECVLSGNDAWEVILPVHLLWAERRQCLQEVTGVDDRPGAFWFKKIKQVRAPAQGQS
jgi:predicted O-methyltransferase YrrM